MNSDTITFSLQSGSWTRANARRERSNLSPLALVNFAQGSLAGDFVAQIQFAQGVFLDVAENANRVANLTEFGINKRGQTEEALQARDIGDEFAAHVALDGLDDNFLAAFEPGAMHLAHRGRGERVWLDVPKVFEESGNGRRAQEIFESPPAGNVALRR